MGLFQDKWWFVINRCLHCNCVWDYWVDLRTIGVGSTFFVGYTIAGAEVANGAAEITDTAGAAW